MKRFKIGTAGEAKRTWLIKSLPSFILSPFSEAPVKASCLRRRQLDSLAMQAQICVLTYGSLDAVACLLKCLSKTIYCIYGQF